MLRANAIENVFSLAFFGLALAGGAYIRVRTGWSFGQTLGLGGLFAASVFVLAIFGRRGIVRVSW